MSCIWKWIHENIDLFSGKEEAYGRVWDKKGWLDEMIVYFVFEATEVSEEHKIHKLQNK